MTYIGTKPKQTECPYINQVEDKLKTTIFPACTCWGQFCDDFEGYCPIRDKERSNKNELA